MVGGVLFLRGLWGLEDPALASVVGGNMEWGEVIFSRSCGCGFLHWGGARVYTDKSESLLRFLQACGYYTVSLESLDINCYVCVKILPMHL